ncbi:putative penicillin binding protein 1A [Caenibius tardaugens NBRC 16725]|uniref:Putative penicillin binding protein 1A n=1 Tax=Caenibius tardaugens NBRC 16725 TaxID=1219035 RepID=U2ZZM2_9SPHN|nr:transglycosylase domain-containing protein [Caenibius tardaugens]AZI38000.1 penicillin-binding protein [Caenibius tardaugens NBRC 16725]GAD47973.1 putative penicillin binding protein 1A [Caenibius tardaugens NBRC 16725]
MADETNFETARYRIRRDAKGAFAWAEGALSWAKTQWRDSRLFRWIAIAAAAFVVLWALVWFALARDLPDAEMLLDYQPPLPTMVRGIDGEIVDSYARERRVQLQFVDFPRPMINAFLAAEDKTFWTHGGIDYTGFVGAVFDYVTKLGSGQRAKGGSTITQQVAKNILVGDEYSITRKLKEMILARRIESVLTKQQILELYLNEIPLGRQSFGVQAAARAYFDKDIGDLQLHEAAFLAILPKAPERYGRAKYADLAMERRNFVLDQMVANDFITREQADAAKAKPLGVIQRRSAEKTVDAGYFMEEVRRQLMGRYGEKAEDGPHSVYAGGLWVRTSLDPKLQTAARDALRGALLRFHGGRGWTGPIATIDVSDGNWQGELVSSYLGINYQNWRVGVVTARTGASARIGFVDGKEAPLTGLPDALKAGDVIVASPEGNGYRVRTIPEISGGFLAQDPNTGRVLAMQGGFDSRLGAFNRATQAMRQPGSTIKPFVYATGLDFGLSPASMVSDSSFCVYQGGARGEKCFRNFSGGGGGEHTMRWGLEQSRNLMTVHIANDAGMPNVIRTFDKVGIGQYKPYLSFALGAGETTVEKMVNAYSALANQGRQFDPSLIDYVQDRGGKVIWRADKRKCTGCNMKDWDGKAMPRFAARGKQVLDARTAYQVVHMLEGVVTRGTAVTLRDLKLPLFGKTGTTSGPTDVWFVGGSPDIVAGVYLGYDKPRSLGGGAQGGRHAAPIFKEFVQKTRDHWSDEPFPAPAGVRMVRIDRRTGKRVFDGWPSSDPKAAIIWEAFKPDTEPRRSTRQDEVDAMRQEILTLLRRGRAVEAQRKSGTTTEQPGNFAEQQGGLY